MYDRRPGFFREDFPPGRRVEAKVKWFNASKGFGFVTLSDGSQDAFLPMAILRRAGYEDAREGASITCEVSAGAKGPLVTTVLNVDNSTAVAPQSGGGEDFSWFLEKIPGAFARLGVRPPDGPQVDIHAQLCLRLASIQTERQNRWQKILGMMSSRS